MRELFQNLVIVTLMIINKLFSNNLINSLIQIGANDGLRFDILNKYIKEYSPKAILVEPILKILKI